MHESAMKRRFTTAAIPILLLGGALGFLLPEPAPTADPAMTRGSAPTVDPAPNGELSQTPEDVEAVRAYLLEAFERQKQLDMAFAAAMPDSAWRWAPNDDVRDFAKQIAHVTHDFFQPWREDGGPSADSTAYLNDRAVMIAQLEEGWDWAIERYGGMSAEDLAAVVPMFTGQRLPQWREATYWIEHAQWTRGSVVPYLRANGVTPPNIRFFTTG
jgi:hypothetical protein